MRAASLRWTVVDHDRDGDAPSPRPAATGSAEAPVDHRAIIRTAQRQHGLISRRQAIALGSRRGAIQVDRWSLGAGTEVREGVYVVGAAAETWRQGSTPACLAGGDDVRASHRHRCPRTRARRPQRTDRVADGRIPPCTDFPARSCTARSTCSRRTSAVVDGIPVTSIVRSLIDVGGRQSEPTLGRWIDRALMAWSTRPRGLARRTTS